MKERFPQPESREKVTLDSVLAKLRKFAIHGAILPSMFMVACGEPKTSEEIEDVEDAKKKIELLQDVTTSVGDKSKVIEKEALELDSLLEVLDEKLQLVNKKSIKIFVDSDAGYGSAYWASISTSQGEYLSVNYLAEGNADPKHSVGDYRIEESLNFKLERNQETGRINVSVVRSDHDYFDGSGEPMEEPPNFKYNVVKEKKSSVVTYTYEGGEDPSIQYQLLESNNNRTTKFEKDRENYIVSSSDDFYADIHEMVVRVKEGIEKADNK